MRVLVITFDCLPRRWVGCYGGLELSTPGFDALSNLGWTYDNCISADVSEIDARPCGLSLAFDHDDVPRLLVDGEPCPVAARIESEDVDEMPVRKRLSDAARWLGEQVHRDAVAWVAIEGVFQSTWPWESEEELEESQGDLELLDEAMTEFLETWQSIAEEDCRLIVAGMTGLARKDARRDETEGPLCDDLMHGPLWLIEGQGEPMGRRLQPVVSTLDIGATIRNWIAPEDGEGPVLGQFLKRDASAAVAVLGPDGSLGLRTEQWFLRRSGGDRPGEDALYRKPDDVFDVFDVASLYPDVTAELAEQLNAFGSLEAE
jgi:hypothetical protein